MKHPWLATFGIVSLLVTFSPTPAFGQYPYPGGPFGSYVRPPVSPYLNLLRAGSSPAVNYYGLVRPQLAFGSAIQNLDQQLSTLGQQTSSLEAEAATAIPPTGRVVGFMTHYRYFQTFSTQYQGSRGQPLASRPATPPTQTQRAASVPGRR
jgi:hypothetical protein